MSSGCLSDSGLPELEGEGEGGEGEVGQTLEHKYHIQKLDNGTLLIDRYKLSPCFIPE